LNPSGKKKPNFGSSLVNISAVSTMMKNNMWRNLLKLWSNSDLQYNKMKTVDLPSINIAFNLVKVLNIDKVLQPKSFYLGIYLQIILKLGTYY
jgi:hypothetical protein